MKITQFYLKEYPDGGFEFSPVGRKPDPTKLAAGFTMVDALPQRVADKLPGGKDYVEPKSPQQVKLEELETRIAELEKTKEISSGK